MNSYAETRQADLDRRHRKRSRSHQSNDSIPLAESASPYRVVRDGQLLVDCLYGNEALAVAFERGYNARVLDAAGKVVRYA